jgi:hypothetical protein
MSQLDVLKSLLRSGARSAQSSLRSLPLAIAVQRAVSELGFHRLTIGDAGLTRAVTHVPEVAAVTVSSGQGRLRIDASFEDGSRLAFALLPAGMAFAPGGAKELSFTIEPASAARDPRSGELVAAVAGEIARNLWRAALSRAPRSDQGASVSCHEDTLVVDLRSVPEVRWALRQRLPALLIEAIKPRSLEIDNGRMLLTLALDRLM